MDERIGIDYAPQVAQPLGTSEGQPEVGGEFPEPAGVALFAYDTGFRMVTQYKREYAASRLDDPGRVSGYVHTGARRGIARGDESAAAKVFYDAYAAVTGGGQQWMMTECRDLDADLAGSLKHAGVRVN